MRFDALAVAGSVGVILLVIALGLAVGLDVSLSRAMAQSLPLALGGAVVAGLLVAGERRGMA